MKLDVLGIFSPVLLIVGGGELMTIENPSLSVHHYSVKAISKGSLMVISSPPPTMSKIQNMPET